MKRLIFLCLMLSPALVKSQYIAIGANINDITTERYVQFSPTNAMGNRRVVEYLKDSTLCDNRWLSFVMRCLAVTTTPLGNPNNLACVDDTGRLYRTATNSLILDTSGTYATKTWVASRGYLTSFAQQNADWNSVSGVTQILNKPVISTSTTTLTEGTNLYYTDTRARASNSAGTGIGYNSTTGVITNSSPDQTVSFTSGSGISVTGTYPAFTVTNTQTPGTGTVTSVGISSSDFTVSGSPITTSGAITANLATSGVTAGTYDKVTVNNKGIVTAGINPTITPTVTRPINSTTYTVSASQPSRVYYTISISCTASIGSAASGSLLFQYSTNGGSTWIDGGSVANSNTVTLAIVLNSVTVQTAIISEEIPANALCRMVPTASAGAVISYVRGKEVTY